MFEQKTKKYRVCVIFFFFFRKTPLTPPVRLILQRNIIINDFSFYSDFSDLFFFRFLFFYFLIIIIVPRTRLGEQSYSIVKRFHISQTRVQFKYNKVSLFYGRSGGLCPLGDFYACIPTIRRYTHSLGTI